MAGSVVTHCPPKGGVEMDRIRAAIALRNAVSASVDYLRSGRPMGQGITPLSIWLDTVSGRTVWEMGEYGQEVLVAMEHAFNNAEPARDSARTVEQGHLIGDAIQQGYYIRRFAASKGLML